LYERLAGSVLYATPALRADASVLMKNRRSQSGLWGHAISGDLPVVLLQIAEPANIGLVRQMVQAHAYWRLKGLVVDLVIWNEDRAGYRQHLQDLIMGVITSSLEAGLLDKPGGIFVRPAHRISSEDRILMQSVARAIISDDKGSLAEQIGRRPLEAPLPKLLEKKLRGAETSVAPETAEQTALREGLILRNDFGGFSADGSEYVIRLSPGQMTPAPWVNVVANPYFGIIPRSSSLGDPTIPLAQLLKPYPQYTTVSLYRNNVGTTAYQGVSMKLQQRLSHGLSYLVAYTRSKLVDDASSVFDASILTGPIANAPVADSYNRALERDYSTGDIPHVFATSATWQAGRWSLTGILTLQSGVPVAVTQSTNNNAFAGFGIQRPNLVGDPALSPDERTVSRWFNTAAFATAPQFTIGTSPRNPVRGPGYRNLDVALARRLPLHGTAALELRAEAFNVTNTPALGAPNGTFGSASFGSITTALDPRVLQFAAKILF
jgi:hypothetical protein